MEYISTGFPFSSYTPSDITCGNIEFFGRLVDRLPFFNYVTV